MDKIKPRTLSGFMELQPDKQVQMDKMRAVLAETYARYGFTPLDTPAIEAAEVLLAKGGGETEKQIYRFTKGDSDLSLRFDLTVPLAKYVAQHYGELTFPFRRFQIGKVYRGERAQRGRFREFYQADIDVIGDGKLDIINEAEVPSIIYKTFTSLGLERFKIRINNRKVLNGFFAILGLEKQAGDVMRTIDKLEKIGAEKVKTILVEDFGVEAATADELLKFIETPGGTEGILAALEAYKGKNEVFDLGAEELKTVATYMQAFGVPADHFEIDLTIARGLDYYTGTVYETAMLDHPEIGSICSGGRYDNLAEYYTDKQLPGVGISIGLTRLFYVLGEQGYLNDQMNKAPADVLILPMTDDMGAAIETATALRSAGIRTQLYGEQKKFKHKIGYADKLGIPFYNREIITMASEDSGVNAMLFSDERLKGDFLTRLRAHYHGNAPVPNDSSKSYLKDEALFAYQVKIIRRLADQGPCVMIGRCADYILAGRPDVVRVFVHADKDFCLEQAMKVDSLPEQEVEKKIAEIDDYRARYYKHHTGHDWYDARNYDLSLNSGVLGFDGTVEEIIKYMEVREQFQK